MTPRSRLLDVGCGCLRLGKALIEFLEPGHYAGVEPCAPVLHAGIQHELDAGVLAAKNPAFLYASDFDFSPLAPGFDFVLANNVFIHCGLVQLNQFLDRVKRVLAPGGKIVMTVEIGDEDEVVGKLPGGTFCYDHADFLHVIYGAVTYWDILNDNGFTQKTLKEFAQGHDHYSRHVKLVTRS